MNEENAVYFEDASNPQGVGWHKRWLLTITARGPSFNTLQEQEDRVQFARWFSEGLFNLFRDHTNFLQFGYKYVRPQGQGNMRRRSQFNGVTDSWDYLNLEESSVTYQVETGPATGFLHAHAFVQLYIEGEENYVLRRFDRFSAANGNPWWVDYWDRGNLAVRPPIRYVVQGQPTLFQIEQGNQIYTVDPRFFGFHVQRVRPRHFEYEDEQQVLDYLAKSIPAGVFPRFLNTTREVDRRQRLDEADEPELQLGPVDVAIN